ncbi:MAG: RluA family pseudouridine synthase [Clostridia bacterium]|nr:RluA family pseudouridine synthase [Clostridia bacterium]
MRILEYIIPSEFDGITVQSFLRGEKGFSAKLIRGLKNVENGMCLNGEHIRSIDPMKAGDVLTVTIPDDPPESVPEPPDLSAFSPDEYPEVLYEDEDILVVTKPGTMAVHPSHNHQGDTLANLVSYHLAAEGKATTFRAVGRLDKGTSGIVICALNPYAADRLQANIDKTYYAIVLGSLSGEGEICAPIFRPDPIKTIRVVDERGDYARTFWKSLKTGEKYSLLEIHLETGRTHQIRVHFAHCGNPLIGDTMYGLPHPAIRRHALHCGRAGFNHPVTGERIELEAPFPGDMKEFINRI